MYKLFCKPSNLGTLKIRTNRESIEKLIFTVCGIGVIEIGIILGIGLKKLTQRAIRNKSTSGLCIAAGIGGYALTRRYFTKSKPTAPTQDSNTAATSVKRESF